jgi:hypothetical protein
MQASFGRPISALFGRQYALSVAAPGDGCSALTNAAAVAGTVVLVLRGTCTFAVKVNTCLHLSCWELVLLLFPAP